MSHHKYHKLGKTKLGRRYDYRPPPANHPLLLSAPKITETVDAVPATVDLRHLCLPIRDQQDVGACSAFSTDVTREVLHTVAAGKMIDGYLSPAYSYARTRMAEGTFPQDSGCTIADEFGTLQSYGVCPESFLPYADSAGTKPTAACDVAAAPFRIDQALQVDSNSEIAMKQVLAKQMPITIGFTVYESFENTGADGICPMPDMANEAVLGGHGVCVCGCIVLGGQVYFETLVHRKSDCYGHLLLASTCFIAISLFE